MEKNLAIVGASYLQLPLIEKAKEMGFITHVFAWAANDVGEKAADFFYPISIIEKDEILEKCKEIGVCGICSIASDLAALTVNYVANGLGLPGNSMDCAMVSTNKHLMRNRFEICGDPSPKSYLVDENTDIEKLKLDYPVIVKPTDRSGSRGIFKLENSNGLRKAISDSISDSFEKKALVEEYVKGQEYSVEYITYQGMHNFLALTHKYTTGAPHFIETAHLEPAPVTQETLSKIKVVVEHALNSLGIENSASHTELKIDETGSIKIIEIGGRMGGDCIGSDLVYYSTGVDFVKAVIQVACGEKPDLTPQIVPFAVKSVFIFSKEDYAQYLDLKQNNPKKIVREVYIRKELLDKATNSSDRAGCYIVSC